MNSPKTQYALTKNGKPVGIVENLKEAVLAIGSACVDLSPTGQYIEGQYIGALISVDQHNNRWSVCRVSDPMANQIVIEAMERHKLAYANFLARV